MTANWSECGCEVPALGLRPGLCDVCGFALNESEPGHDPQLLKCSQLGVQCRFQHSLRHLSQQAIRPTNDTSSARAFSISPYAICHHLHRPSSLHPKQPPHPYLPTQMASSRSTALAKIAQHQQDQVQIPRLKLDTDARTSRSKIVSPTAGAWAGRVRPQRCHRTGAPSRRCHPWHGETAR